MNEPSEPSESPDLTPPPPNLSTVVAAGFYGLMVLVAFAIGDWWLDLDLLEWHNRWETQVWLDAALGVGLGVMTVVASRILERKAEWMRTLSTEFRKILGPLSPTQVLVLAVTSGVGEELFFRGFLQQALSDVWLGNNWLGLVVASLIFGAIHVGPDRRKFLPWTLMAIVLGFAFGLLYLYTGNILAPVLAHFTINFFNLLHITRPQVEADDGSAP